MERQEYSKEHYDLLKKAGLIGEGTIIIRAKISSDKRPYSPDGRNWTTNPRNGVPTMDRTAITDYAVPVVEGNRVKGYWRNKVNAAEAEVLQYDLGIPVYDFARPGKDKDNPIPDSQIPLFDGKEYDLSDPAQMAEWNVVQHSSLLAPTQEAAFSDDWCSFYWVNVDKQQAQMRVEVDSQLDFIVSAKGYDRNEKCHVARIMHHKGYRTIENIATATDSLLEMVFDSSILNLPAQLKECMAVKDKVMTLKLYSLVEMGRVERYGIEGPYYHERTNPQQERGKLLGNTTEEAVYNLKATDNLYLLSYLEGREQVQTEKSEKIGGDLGEKLRMVAFETMTEGKAKNMTKEGLVTWLQSIGEKPNKEALKEELTKQVLEALAKHQEQQA